MLNSKKFIIVASFVGLFFLSLGSTLLFYYFTSPNSPVAKLSGTTKTNKKSKFDLSQPKVAECPINGQMYTKAEKDAWEARRPLTVIIENHLEARPESGLSKADVVYEAVAEGGITRFLAVFYCGAVAENVKLAPIRSARIYFVNFAAGYGLNPIFLHQGGANDFCSDCPGGVKPRGQINPIVNAYASLDKLGWRNGTRGNDMDGGFNIGYPVVERNQYRLSSTAAAWEHSVVADLDEVYKEANKRGYNYNDSDGVAWTQGFKKWIFQDDKAASTPEGVDIKFNFWDSMPGYDVGWKYDSTSNSYKRSNGGKEHIDWESDKSQLSAKNVVILYAKETGPVDPEHHMFYQVIGTGKAIVFQNGQVIQGTWSKASQLDREVFYDTNGSEIKMVRGTTWVEVVPSQNAVTY